MQINATLVKGKARVQFGANKVCTAFLSLSCSILHHYLCGLFACRNLWRTLKECWPFHLFLYRINTILPEHNSHTNHWFRFTKRMVSKKTSLPWGIRGGNTELTFLCCFFFKAGTHLLKKMARRSIDPHAHCKHGISGQNVALFY